MKTILVLLVLIARTFAYTVNGPTELTSDGTRLDTANAVAAVAGGIVNIPPGSFTWATGVSINNGVHLRGGGSGRVVARSKSSIAVGTGAKTFTLEAEGVAVIESLKSAIANGATLRIAGAVDRGNYMEGTVTSLSGTTLVMNITSIGGSGTIALWWISSIATTTIVNGTSSSGSGGLLFLGEDATHSVEVSGIRFTDGGSDSFALIWISRSVGGKPVLIHDCRFEVNGSGSVSIQIQTNSNKGVVWNCSFDASPFAQAPSVLQCANPNLADSWANPSTMGMADTNGDSNFYVEDCDFHGWLNATDWSENAKGTMRHCLFDIAGVGTHGPETGEIGCRHFEVYDSQFRWETRDSVSVDYPINQWFFVRGGTFVIADNLIDDITSQNWGNKSEVNMIVMQLQRNVGPDHCHGMDIAGIQYPAMRQPGFGRVTGLGGNDAAGVYKGDSEPAYIWGTTGHCSVGVTDYGTGNPQSCVGATDSTVDYVVAGRDFFNNGTAKPGYAKYTYPHPLRSGPPTARRLLRLVP